MQSSSALFGTFSPLTPAYWADARAQLMLRQRGGIAQAVLHRHFRVGDGMPEEGRRRICRDLRFQRIPARI